MDFANVEFMAELNCTVACNKVATDCTCCAAPENTLNVGILDSFYLMDYSYVE